MSPFSGSLLSALVVPLSGFVLMWMASGDVAEGYSHFLWLLPWSALLTPFLLIVLAHQMAPEARSKSEWANLRIEE